MAKQTNTKKTKTKAALEADLERARSIIDGLVDLVNDQDPSLSVWLEHNNNIVYLNSASNAEACYLEGLMALAGFRGAMLEKNRGE